MAHTVTFLILMFTAAMTAGSRTPTAHGLEVWSEFATALKTGTMKLDRIRPLDELGESYKPVLLGYLETLHSEAHSQNWSVQPEIFQDGNRIKCIFPWTTEGQQISYCFSFVTEDTVWYFQHLETIFIRLDTISKLPTSQFPDISETQKAWAREEIYWSFIVINLYLPVSRAMGKQYGLDLLKDGAGYFVGAKTWVPFASPHKSFILYLCWEQANLRGNDVTLKKLEDDEAVVHLGTHFFRLYFTAAHLKPVIPIEEYRQIFETIWQNRASAAGWNLKISYTQDYSVDFHFSRTSVSGESR